MNLRFTKRNENSEVRILRQKNRCLPLKRILFLSHSSNLEGSERSLIDIVRYLNPEKFEKYVICPSRGKMVDELVKYKIPYFFSPMHRWVFSLDYMSKSRLLNMLYLAGLLFKLELRKITKIVKRERIDFIFTNTITLKHGAIIAKKMNILHFWRISESLESDSHLGRLSIDGSQIARFVIDNSDKIIFNSIATKKAFFNKIKCNSLIDKLKNKSHILYPICDYPDNRAPKERLNKQANNEIFIISIVGSIAPTKGQKEALAAFKEISAVFSFCRLEFVGPIRRRDYFKKLKKFIKDNGLKDKVKFLGFIDNIYNYLSNVDILIMPSWNEPFGRVAMEGMGLGLPVIVSCKSGVAEIISSWDDGILVTPQSVHEIALAMKKLITDDKLREKISDNAYKKFLSVNDFKIFQKRLEEIVSKD